MPAVMFTANMTFVRRDPGTIDSDAWQWSLTCRTVGRRTRPGPTKKPGFDAGLRSLVILGAYEGSEAGA